MTHRPFLSLGRTLLQQKLGNGDSEIEPAALEESLKHIQLEHSLSPSNQDRKEILDLGLKISEEAKKIKDPQGIVLFDNALQWVKFKSSKPTRTKGDSSLLEDDRSPEETYAEGEDYLSCAQATRLLQFWENKEKKTRDLREKLENQSAKKRLSLFTLKYYKTPAYKRS